MDTLLCQFLYMPIFFCKNQIISFAIFITYFFSNYYNYTPNKLAELSAIAPSTLRALLANNVDNPSSTIIFKICKTLKIELKDFYDSPLFDMEKLEY